MFTKDYAKDIFAEREKATHQEEKCLLYRRTKVRRAFSEESL